MNQLCVPNRLKAIKKTSSGLIGKFPIKKNRILFESSFFLEIFSVFFVFLGHLKTSHFSYRACVNKKPHLRQMKPNDQKNSLSRNYS